MEASLEEAFETFSLERANLIARTQRANALVTAALGQLRRPLAPVGPAGAIGNQQQPKAGSDSVDAGKLKERNTALAKKLQALKAQVAQQLAAAQRLPQRADSGVERPLAHTAQADEVQLAGQQVQQLRQEAAQLEEQVQQALGAAVPQLSAAVAAGTLAQPWSTAGVPAVAGPKALAAPATPAAAAMGAQLAAEPAAQPGFASHLQSFPLFKDWSSIPLQQQGQRREAFQPGTSVRDFACHEDNMVAYLTTQAGQRDGKRRRLAAGMLSQRLAPGAQQPQPPSSSGVPPEQASLAAAWAFLPQHPQHTQQQPLQQQQQSSIPWRPQVEKFPVVQRWQEGPAERDPMGEVEEGGGPGLGAPPSPWHKLMPGSVGGEGDEAGLGPAPLSVMPSRTPKRKRSARSADGDSQGVQSLLAPAFGILAGPEHGTSILHAQFSMQQHLQEEGDPEFETFRLFDELWHGVGGHSSLPPARRAAQRWRRGGPSDAGCTIC